MSEPRNRRVQSMFEIDKRVIRPEALAEFVAGDRHAGFLEQGSQNLERLSLQPDLDAVLAEHTLFQVDLEGSKVGDAACMT
jgi:hypothetical protein